MDNSIVVQESIKEDLAALSPEQRERVLDALDDLGRNPLQGSKEVSGFNLRTRDVGGNRIYFRYVPEKKAVLVTSVSPSDERTPA